MRRQRTARRPTWVSVRAAVNASSGQRAPASGAPTAGQSSRTASTAAQMRLTASPTAMRCGEAGGAPGPGGPPGGAPPPGSGGLIMLLASPRRAPLFAGDAESLPSVGRRTPRRQGAPRGAPEDRQYNGRAWIDAAEGLVETTFYDRALETADRATLEAHQLGRLRALLDTLLAQNSFFG